MKKDASAVKLAIFGCGHWGPNHICNFRALSVTWAVDQDPQRRNDVSSAYFTAELPCLSEDKQITNGDFQKRRKIRTISRIP